MSLGLPTIRYCSAISVAVLLALVTAPQTQAKGMPAHMEEQQERDAPLPAEMQGHWVDVDDPSTELVVSGGEVACFGQTVEYDYKLVGKVDGAVTVSLKVKDETKEDTFQRSNITELVITPDGELHAYNVKFASQFVRAPR
jgi:hypothetical protein